MGQIHIALPLAHAAIFALGVTASKPRFPKTSVRRSAPLKADALTSGKSWACLSAAPAAHLVNIAPRSAKFRKAVLMKSG